MLLIDREDASGRETACFGERVFLFILEKIVVVAAITLSAMVMIEQSGAVSP